MRQKKLTPLRFIGFSEAVKRNGAASFDDDGGLTLFASGCFSVAKIRKEQAEASSGAEAE